MMRDTAFLMLKICGKLGEVRINDTGDVSKDFIIAEVDMIMRQIVPTEGKSM